MLNTPLYNALTRLFKETRVANEDERPVFRAPKFTAQQNRLRTKFKDRKDLRPERLYGGEQYTVCCPFCGDRRFRLYISHAWDKDLRSEDGRVIYAGKRAICHNEDCLSDAANFRRLDAMIKSELRPGDDKPLKCSTDENALAHRVVDPPPTVPVDDPRADEDAVAYLRNRGYDPVEMARGWGVGVGDVWFYPKPSLIFPVWQNGVRKCWQARYTGEDYKALGKPKYFWPAGVRKSWMLYNMDMAGLYPGVIVTEGVLDAIRMGQMGVALFGKKPSPRQEELLASRWRNGALIWIPDGDDPESVAAAETFVAKWNAAGVFAEGASIVRLPKGDPGDFTRASLWDMVFEVSPFLKKYAEEWRSKKKES